ncbi:hypothetical protein [Gordonia sp. (in: high G+C Gram-positive bacteria)]|uniref:hypothetical protein n=1 Tax=Gordonia sp. (in: high G+C Gram-positive bacteria) TaxID=84139 RepID=UPI0016A57821|nr:hypothetical protein [Gordonia sp. (in: high G+C Gram-positive bacteria)]NLG47803.1 hypothetical protein [Gordonia sp. (in: high G+C Gram-positive bacteria)]
MTTGGNRGSRSSSPKRTPRVAGRNAPRVTVNATPDAREYDVTAVAPEPSAAGISGVERKRRAAAAAKSAQEQRESEQRVGAPPRDTSATYRLAAVLGAVATVIGVAALIFALQPGADVGDNRAFVDTAATQDVLTAARNSVCIPVNFDYKDLDKWAGQVRENFSGQALDEYEKVLKTNKSILTQGKSASECQVDTVALQDLRDDTAEVLASLLVSTTVDGTIQEKNVAYTQYGMEKIDGRWMITRVGTLS